MTIVKLFLKHDDRASISMDDYEHIGYLPYVGVLGGDDTLLKIDNETGKIIGWKPLQIDNETGEIVEDEE